MKKISLSVLLFSFLFSLGFSQYSSQKLNCSPLENNANLSLTALSSGKFNSNQLRANNLNIESKVNLKSTPDNNSKIQSQLSSLWTVVTLEIVVADLLSLYIPESNEEWKEYADGKEKEYMIGGAAAFVIPISMIYLSQALPYKANRISNLVAVGLTTTWIIAGASWNEPSYLICLGAEVAALSLITWKVLKWKNPAERTHNFGLNIHPDKEVYGLNYAYRF